jgi:predicted transcriptional regulator
MYINKKPDLKIKAINLRKLGLSYSEINKHLGISKSTLSSWFSKKDWSKKIENIHIKNQKKILSKSLKSARLVLKKLKIERDRDFIKEAKTEFTNLKSKPLFLVGVMAYWGEGNKANGSRVALANTDPVLLEIAVNFYRKCLKVPESSLRVELFIYEDIDILKVKKFWSMKLKIPTSQFIKVQVLKSRSKLTKRRSKYGVCSIYFSSTKQIIKIREWIRLLGVEMRV